MLIYLLILILAVLFFIVVIYSPEAKVETVYISSPRPYHCQPIVNQMELPLLNL